MANEGMGQPGVSLNGREAGRRPSPAISACGTPEQERALVDRPKAAADAPPAEPGYDPLEEDLMMTIKRVVPARRGKFPFVSKAMVDKA